MIGLTLVDEIFKLKYSRGNPDSSCGGYFVCTVHSAKKTILKE